MSKHYDVIVAGGGPSGSVAAIAAARGGARVLLLERGGFLGGMNTAAMVYPLMTFHAGDKQIVTGIPQEIVNELVRRGASPGHIRDPLGVASTVTPFEPEILKQIYFEKVLESGVDLLLHTYVIGAVVEGDVVKGIRCANKSGQATYEGRVIIDATGDGDVAAYSGAEFWEGREKDGLTQPMTMMFRVGGVDLDRVKSYMKQHPEQFILDQSLGDVESLNFIAVSGFFDIVDRARKNGDLKVERDRVLFFEAPRRGEVVVNMTRVLRASGTSAADLTRAEVEGHAQVHEAMAFLKKYVPGFEDAYLIACGAQIGVRESRRIKGRYTLTVEDIMEGRAFEGSVARGAFPIDLHDPAGKELQWIRIDRSNSYDIPYRVMVPRRLLGLLVTGRCISATHEAIASARITATAMALGQAAGAAAALAVRDEVDVSEVDVGKLQRTLAAQGASVGKAYGSGEVAMDG